MTTVIDNNQRVFQVITSTGKQVFCNLSDLNKIIAEIGTHEGYFKLNHFWNNKPERVTKKHLKELFESAGIKIEFYY